MDRRYLILLAALILAGIGFVGLRFADRAAYVPNTAPTAAARAGNDDIVMTGEARSGSVTVALGEAVENVEVREAKVAGRGLVLIDAGHGGRDGGAPGVGGLREKNLTLILAKELADRLEERGQVRVALTRSGDSYPTLEERAALAKRLGAGLFVSLHMDAAPNDGARGVTIYSLSDVASSKEAARFAQKENRAGGDRQVTSERDAVLQSLLTDVAMREQMEASADIAVRMVRAAKGSVPLRPQPHQFANFQVLRQSDAPAVLVEAGYLSNPIDARRLSSREGRAPLVSAMSQAIEAYLLRQGA